MLVDDKQGDELNFPAGLFEHRNRNVSQLDVWASGFTVSKTCCRKIEEIAFMSEV